MPGRSASKLHAVSTTCGHRRQVYCGDIVSVGLYLSVCSSPHDKKKPLMWMTRNLQGPAVYRLFAVDFFPGPSYTHCSLALTFAWARLFCLTIDGCRKWRIEKNQRWMEKSHPSDCYGAARVFLGGSTRPLAAENKLIWYPTCQSSQKPVSNDFIDNCNFSTIVVPHVRNALYSWRKVRAL